MRLKPIIPSLREKKRYIGFEVVSNQDIALKEARDAISYSLKTFAGDLGLAKAGMLFLKDWKNNKGIVRVGRKEVNAVKAAMALVRDVGGKKAIIKSFAVSGMLDKIRKKL